ncbi:RelA/SpoT domain-containing protein [Candidatus Poriferisodalis sp.]|uniref:RelA/SpoT domain-containing protein n=1 Tax=Candidatus Poriferisodalis sp. TaxID=3101277 RepID=UPI003B598350
MPADSLQLSKNQINKAGRTLRRYFSKTQPIPTGAEARSALGVLRNYRSAHSAALLSARMGLQSCIRTEEVLDIILSQRLKRIPTIIDKLSRQPTMALTTMADIAGCRAVFLTQEDVNRVRARFMSNALRRSRRSGQTFTDRVYDYVAEPRDTGYRAIHIHTTYQGMRVEVQLRTLIQHAWAVRVEDRSTETGVDLKSGHGPEEELALYRRMAETIAEVDNEISHSADPVSAALLSPLYAARIHRDKWL